jgi:peptide deformylase
MIKPKTKTLQILLLGISLSACNPTQIDLKEQPVKTTSAKKDQKMDNLPDYSVVYDLNNRPKVLTHKAQTVKFPLSQEDKDAIKILEEKFDHEENCAGLAAPQIGIGKRIIVFEVKDDPDLKKWRPDLEQTMPKAVWINPSYKAVGTATHEDYEACFSVNEMAGNVKRFKKISYEAWLPDGTKVTGTASGFLARLIQHEIDHTNGRLYVDLVPEGQLHTLEEYRKMRAEKMGKEIE